MPHAPLVPASLAFVDGIPYAAQFDDVYHSADGGPDQARHVFLGGNQLPVRWRGKHNFTILETGFGLGLNFLATWAEWSDDPARSAQLHYLALEKHPFSAPDLATLHARWPELASFSEQLLAAWPPLVPGFHRLLLDGGRIVLTLIFGDIRTCLPQVDASVDAFYLDGFSPGKNPDMWEPSLLSRFDRLSAPQATLATYTVSAIVRQSLTQAGFVCEKQAGFGHKKDMLAAHFAPRWQPPPRRMPSAEMHAIVIGAGLAGSAACERLTARGWQVTLIERHAQPAQEASGNRAGIVMPLLSKDDNPASRLSRAAYLFTLQWWAHLGGIGRAFSGEQCGVLQLARDAAHARIQEQIAASHRYPAEFAQWLDPNAASALLKSSQAHGGWLFPRGGWVYPASLCDAMLAACANRVQRRFDNSAFRLEQSGQYWQVIDHADALIAEAPVVIFANGTNAIVFSQTRQLPLQTIRGQITHVDAALLPEFPVVVCGDGYLTRPAQGICSVGASYDADADPQLRQASQQENLARLAQVIPSVANRIETFPMAGRVGFRTVSPDRLPLVGALPVVDQAGNHERLRNVPRFPGLYGLLAYASRGLIWAPFAAELLAAELNGEPLPVERDLVAALDPARFMLKAYRRGMELPLPTSILE